ncbi:MAG: hypothetical protein ACAI35_26030 [Candidatus Methylacidiphilales bacterium]
MAINVSTILKGPALVKYNSATFYSKGDITLTTQHQTMNVEVDRYGKVDERVLDTEIKVTFTPSGEWEALSVLFSHVTRPIGDFITDNTDKPLVIHTFAGTKLTLHNAAITKMPNIRGSATETLLAEVEFTSFVKNNVERTTANSRWTIENEALSDTTFNPASILVQSYTLGWGDAPWDSMSTKDGFTLEWTLGLTPVNTDKDGVVTQQLSNLDVAVKAQVLGITESDLMTKMLIQGSDAARGRSLSSEADNLVISSTGVHIIVYGAALKTSPQTFGRTSLRIGELEWIATRTFTGGTANPLVFVGTADPGE